MTTAEWRDTNDVRLRENQSHEDAALSIPESPTGKCLILTHYAAAATDVSHSPMVLDSGTTLSDLNKRRKKLVCSSRQSGIRLVFKWNVSSILQIGEYGFHDDVSTALIYRENVLLPDRDYAHTLLGDRGRIWMAEVCTANCTWSL